MQKAPLLSNDSEMSEVDPFSARTFPFFHPIPGAPSGALADLVSCSDAREEHPSRKGQVPGALHVDLLGRVCGAR
jgi:hypothetical protein